MVNMYMHCSPCMDHTDCSKSIACHVTASVHRMLLIPYQLIMLLVAVLWVSGYNVSLPYVPVHAQGWLYVFDSAVVFDANLLAVNRVQCTIPYQVGSWEQAY